MRYKFSSLTLSLAQETSPVTPMQDGREERNQSAFERESGSSEHRAERKLDNKGAVNSRNETGCVKGRKGEVAIGSDWKVCEY